MEPPEMAVEVPVAPAMCRARRNPAALGGLTDRLAFFLSKDMLPETRIKTQAKSEFASVTHSRASAGTDGRTLTSQATPVRCLQIRTYAQLRESSFRF